MKQPLFIIFCVLVALYSGVLTVYAEGEFAASYDVQYAISPVGKTIVTQNVVLTNRLSNLYPKRYSILIDSEKIDNVIAYDAKGEIKSVISQKDGKTEIVLPFNEHPVGLGKSLHFTLRYESFDIALKNGAVWDVNVPPIIDDPDILVYDVSLSVPESFGEVAFLSPTAANGRKWNKEQMVRGGISAAYGKEQFYSVSLKYHLDNTNSSPQDTDIALPPDTAYQKVSITEIQPAPTRVTRDKDGNWLARYRVPPNSPVDVETKLTVSVSLFPRSDYGREKLPDSTLVSADTYWETGDSTISELSKSYTTPRQIYEYVLSTLGYDDNRINQNPIRKGAVSALANPKNSICMEFTDLFVAIARAAGIPAREAVGYAYTTNPKLRPLSLVSDILHAWPEYFDSEKGLWIPVDPTWASTTGGVNYFDKLDFNHIVFAIHGSDSELPYPAGFYREAGKPGKVVDVSFADPSVTHATGKLSSTILFPGFVFTGFETKGMISVKNTSGVGIDDISVNVASVPVGASYDSLVEHIPPITDVDIPLSFKPPSLFNSGRARLLVTVNGELTNVYFTLVPTPVLGLAGGMLLLIFGLIVYRAMKK